MTLRLAEGFETFGMTIGNTVQEGLNRRYSNFHSLSLSNYASSMQLATGRNGGRSVAACNSNYQYFYHAVASDDVPTNDTWIIGLAVKFDSSFPDSNSVVVLAHTNASTTYWNFALKLLDDGLVAAYGGRATPATRSSHSRDSPKGPHVVEGECWLPSSQPFGNRHAPHEMLFRKQIEKPSTSKPTCRNQGTHKNTQPFHPLGLPQFE